MPKKVDKNKTYRGLKPTGHHKRLQDRRLQRQAKMCDIDWVLATLEQERRPGKNPQFLEQIHSEKCKPKDKSTAITDGASVTVLRVRV